MPGRVPFQIRRGMLVLPPHQRGRDDEIRSGPVASSRDIVQYRQPEQGFDVGVVGLGLKRIPKEDEQVNSILGNRGADLLVASQRTGGEAGDGQSQFFP